MPIAAPRHPQRTGLGDVHRYRIEVIRDRQKIEGALVRKRVPARGAPAIVSQPHEMESAFAAVIPRDVDRSLAANSRRDPAMGRIGPGSLPSYDAAGHVDARRQETLPIIVHKDLRKKNIFLPVSLGE